MPRSIGRFKKRQPTGSAPGIPVGLAATAASVTATAVPLTWTATATATKYRVAYSTTQLGTYTTLATEPTTASFTVSGLSPSQVYWFKVAAGNANGWSNFCSPISQSTASSALCPPGGISKALPLPAGTDLAAAINGQGINKTYCLSAGTYFLNNFLNPPSGTTILGAGVVEGSDGYLASTSTIIKPASGATVDKLMTGGTDVTVKRLTFDSPTVSYTTEIDKYGVSYQDPGNSGRGINSGNNLTIVECFFKNCGQNGWGGSGQGQISYSTMDNCAYLVPETLAGSSAGALKTTKAVNVDTCKWSRCPRQMLWYDVHAPGCTVQNSLFDGAGLYGFSGVLYEISGGTAAAPFILRNNTFKHIKGPGAKFAGSKHIKIEANIFDDNGRGTGGSIPRGCGIDFYKDHRPVEGTQACTDFNGVCPYDPVGISIINNNFSNNGFMQVRDTQISVGDQASTADLRHWDNHSFVAPFLRRP